MARGQGFSHTPQEDALDSGYMLLRLFTEPFGRISHTFYATMDSRDIHTSFHSSDAFRFLVCSPSVLVLVCSLQKGFASEMVSQLSRSLWTLLVDVISNHFQEVIADGHTASNAPDLFTPCRRALKAAFETVMPEIDIFASSTGNFNYFGWTT